LREGWEPRTPTRHHFFKKVADNFRPFVHTIQEKGLAMGGNRKEQKQGELRFLFPVPYFLARVPPPPYDIFKLWKTFADYL
jgi:hypothetical protein